MSNKERNNGSLCQCNRCAVRLWYARTVGAAPVRLVITEGSTRAIEATSELVCMLTLLLIVSLIRRCC